ncbi:MAG: aminomethyl transferase family protein [Acidimicrobiaceae bacterium]|nr:aminomethyltransferase family protein [Acidimicrobiaceae bacterium]MXW89272.1 aminomethyl transferase family protein [Acidimicrobiaceae bacterium]
MGEGAFRGTPFHESTSARCESPWWFGWGGYVVPDVYSDPHAELDAIRSGVAMCDMSPIPRYEVSGPDAQACMDYLIPRDVSKMGVGHAWYTPWCSPEGKVAVDGIVFRFEHDRFVMSADRCELLLREHSHSFDVQVSDVIDDYGILSLQGPQSRDVLEAVTGEDWSDLRFSRVRSTTVAGAPVRVARQGFTGELGYELWVDRPDGHQVWEAVAEAGASFDIRPAAEYALEIARVEAGIILISADYTPAVTDAPSTDNAPNPDDFVTPYELNLGHCVNLNKAADFVGRAALEEEHRRGPRRRLVGLQFDLGAVVGLFLAAGMAPEVSPRVRWDHLPLLAGDEVVGRASSVTWSPTASKLVGFGLVPTELAEIGTSLTVQWSDFWGHELGPASAEVCEYPFIELRR